MMSKNKELVYICSPLSIGDYRVNINRAIEYCRYFTMQGLNPIAPHIYYTQFLNDSADSERIIGMQLGKELLSLCNSLYVIIDYGITKGMCEEILEFNKTHSGGNIYFINFKDLALFNTDIIEVAVNKNRVYKEITNYSTYTDLLIDYFIDSNEVVKLIGKSPKVLID